MVDTGGWLPYLPLVACLTATVFVLCGKKKRRVVQSIAEHWEMLECHKRWMEFHEAALRRLMAAKGIVLAVNERGDLVRPEVNDETLGGTSTGDVATTGGDSAVPVIPGSAEMKEKRSEPERERDRRSREKERERERDMDRVHRGGNKSREESGGKKKSRSSSRKRKSRRSKHSHEGSEEYEERREREEKRAEKQRKRDLNKDGKPKKEEKDQKFDLKRKNDEKKKSIECIDIVSSEDEQGETRPKIVKQDPVFITSSDEDDVVKPGPSTHPQRTQRAQQVRLEKVLTHCIFPGCGHKPSRSPAAMLKHLKNEHGESLDSRGLMAECRKCGMKMGNENYVQAHFKVCKSEFSFVSKS